MGATDARAGRHQLVFGHGEPCVARVEELAPAQDLRAFDRVDIGHEVRVREVAFRRVRNKEPLRIEDPVERHGD
ncbi:MAG: hypothetical protein EPO50_18430 [Reyranella sp.]|nr:MAG: hypothetical protein EPO50_18430 [Reyranella sp.]